MNGKIIAFLAAAALAPAVAFAEDDAGAKLKQAIEQATKYESYSFTSAIDMQGGGGGQGGQGGGAPGARPPVEGKVAKDGTWLKSGDTEVVKVGGQAAAKTG